MSEKRLEWIDAAKAIGIILVYIGHCDIPGVNRYVYFFHMPLFFIISGFCWNVKKNQQYKFTEFFKKKFKSYILPYFKICLVCLVLLGISEAYYKFGISSDFYEIVKKYMFGIVVLSRGTTEWLPHCSPVWFLTCLFCAEILMWFIMKQKQAWIYVLLSGVIGYIMSFWGKFPWNIDTACTAIPLIWFGIAIKKYFKNKMTNGMLILLICFSILFFKLGVVEVDFDANRYENIILMYVGSILVSVTILAASQQIVWGGVFTKCR